MIGPGGERASGPGHDPGREAARRHFAGVADAYRRFRPRYPGGLFEALTDLCEGRNLAWDCGAGNGQVASELVTRFGRVVATDANPEPLARGLEAPFLRAAATAEAAPLADASVDLIAVGQALHWFDLERFYAQVRRVTAAGAVLAAFAYELPTVGPEVDSHVQRFRHDVLGPWWSPARRHVEAGYRTLPFPFVELELPPFELTAECSANDFVGYLGTWSALGRARAELGRDPLEPTAELVRRAWGDPAGRKTVRWPLAVRAGRVHAVEPGPGER